MGHKGEHRYTYMYKSMLCALYVLWYNMPKGTSPAEATSTITVKNQAHSLKLCEDSGRQLVS